MPLNRTFAGLEKFHEMVARAEAEHWSGLPLSERVSRSALAMQGTPYVSYTLEIDDHIESPSVNFHGQDCWTFFETALALGRMFGRSKSRHTPADLLREIELTRYRGGVCHGHYLDRIHYLDEWFRDNHRRSHVRDITRSLGATVPLEGRRIDEMTLLWKSYRYLNNNPELRPGMAAIEAELQTHAFHYLPKQSVQAIEPGLQSGDIIGIVTHLPHVYCSHVGLALRTRDGACHFMHASANQKRVMIDKSVSGYLNDFKKHAGIVVARPV